VIQRIGLDEPKTLLEFAQFADMPASHGCQRFLRIVRLLRRGFIAELSVGRASTACLQQLGMCIVEFAQFAKRAGVAGSRDFCELCDYCDVLCHPAADVSELASQQSSPARNFPESFC
jgi:hypothetical protein